MHNKLNAQKKLTHKKITKIEPTMQKTKSEPTGNTHSKPKDHLENDLRNCDTLITNICGRKIELNRQQQLEVREYIYAIGSRAKDTGDPLRNAAKYSDIELRGLLLIMMKKTIDRIPSEKLLDAVVEIMCRVDGRKGKVTKH